MQVPVSPTSDSVPAVIRGTGPPVVFLHGYPLNHTIWNAQLSPLSRNRKVVLLDLPGYGLAEGREVPTTLQGFSEAVHSLFDRLSLGPATIVGHSFGGYVALQLYRDHPDRFRALALLSTRSEADTPDTKAKRMATVKRLEAPGETLDLGATVQSLVADPTWRQRPAVLQTIRGIVESVPPSTLIPTLQAIADRPDLTPMLASIRVPTLVLWGEQDELIPKEQTQALVHRIPRSVGVGFPDAGHLAPLESETAFTAAMQRFLEAHP